MKDTILKRLKEGYKDYMGQPGKPATTPRKEWVVSHPAQVVTTIGMVTWCYYTQEAIDAMADDPMALTNWFDTNVT